MSRWLRSASSCALTPSSSAAMRIGVPCSSVPETISTSCPVIRMYRLYTSEGTPKPATWPMWRGPFAYGHATADKPLVMPGILGSAEIRALRPAALELVEPGGPGDEEHTVPEPTGRLPL